MGRRAQTWRRGLKWCALSALVLGCALAVWVVAVPFPEGALAPAEVTSLRLLDRQGGTLREVLSDREGRGRWLGLDAVSPHIVAATVHAEDKRFYDHPGFDPIAIGRSVVYNARRRRVVTGASTLTQQTVKLTLSQGKARTLGVKLEELVWAVRLELARSKEAILEQYLNRAPYGNQLFGVEAAARMYFDKPASKLSLAESALLAGLPQAPTSLNPYTRLERAQKRQRVILDAMLERGAISKDAHARAVSEPLRLASRRGSVRAPHFTDHVLKARLTPDEVARGGEVQTTLDGTLQRAVEGIVRARLEPLEARGATQGAALVLDVATGEVLAWVGSRDYWSEAHGGANDGVLARRQPGSALKPFIYGVYMERGGTAADMLEDLPTQFATSSGVYVPKNYDRRYRGPVSLRESLGSSLNVPAVQVLERLGVASMLTRLRAMGLSLDEDASHYGLGLALGDGEVTLLELTGAYAALGRLGVWRPERAVLRVGDQTRSGSATRRRVLDRDAAYMIADVLSDDTARVHGFGEAGPLALPYAVAAKTGTSTGFRDNLAFGTTPEYAVGVWVGNFDGSPMDDVSGATGAAPILREIFQTLYPDAADASDVMAFAKPRTVQAHTVCVFSGQPAGAHCPTTRRELFAQGRRGASGAPGVGGDRERGPDACAMHRRVRVDTRNGLLASASCGAEWVEERVVHAVPPAWREWAHERELALMPEGASPLCPGTPDAHDATEDARSAGRLPVEIVQPIDGDLFLWDPEGSRSDQRASLRARIAPWVSPSRTLTWFVDGAPLTTVESPFTASWALERGVHHIGVGRGDAPEHEVEVEVR